MKIERVENMCGGEGHVIIKRLLGDKELNGKCKMYAEVTLEHGCSLGYHEHHQNSETYYILSGEGEYNDNGSIRGVKPGDVDLYSRWKRTCTQKYRDRTIKIHGADHQ